MKIKVLELFAGIGACSKALERLGIEHEIVDAVEIDKYAVKSFNAIHNTNFEPQDICNWDKNIEVDLIMHGSPCQDFSLAGKQAGGDEGSGTRSSLMYETIRIVKKLKPKYVIWENVKNLLSKKHRHNFDAYLETMEQLGYTNYYQVLNAKDYGIPQNRERVFTISIKKDINKVFTFPHKQELKLKLKDMLEDEVDEKYYLSDVAINKIKRHKNKIIENENPDESSTLHAGYYKMGGRDQQYIRIKEATKQGYKEAYEGDGVNISSRMKYQRGNVQKESIQTLTTSGGNERGVVINPLKDKSPYGWHFEQNVYDVNGITRSVKAGGGSGNIPKAILNNNNNLRIRKLTPKECWRLMGFDDKDYEKAAFKKEISYIEGGIKCNAKLKIVNEKQRLLDTETYVLCTTNDMLDMETPTQIKWKKSIKNENNEKIQNVNIAIEMLEEVEQKECVANIIKCGKNTTILYTLMEELDQHHMAIIELEKKGNKNIEKYMKITLEENLNPMKLYTISTLIEQIIKSKIYTCITQKANIQGNIAIIEDCKKNLKMMRLSNLKMEYITRLNSDTMLYKQAGNSIVVNVLEAILTNLLK